METDEFINELKFVDPDLEYDEENGEARESLIGRLPTLSAYNESEPDRLPRLSRAYGAASAAIKLMSHRYQRLWDGAITALHDHKGGLLITWRDVPSRIMFEGVILGAWEANGEHGHAHALAGLIGRAKAT